MRIYSQKRLERKRKLHLLKDKALREIFYNHQVSKPEKRTGRWQKILNWSAIGTLATILSIVFWIHAYRPVMHITKNTQMNYYKVNTLYPDNKTVSRSEAQYPGSQNKPALGLTLSFENVGKRSARNFKISILFLDPQTLTRIDGFESSMADDFTPGMSSFLYPFLLPFRDTFQKFYVVCWIIYQDNIFGSFEMHRKQRFFIGIERIKGLADKQDRGASWKVKYLRLDTIEPIVNLYPVLESYR